MQRLKIEILKNRWQVTIKNSVEGSGTCRTIIAIDNAIVYFSEPYKWEHPSADEMNFKIEIGDNDELVKGEIRNIKIICFE